MTKELLTNTKAIKMVLEVDAIKENAALVAKLERMLLTFEHKNKNKKPTKSQLQNMEIKEDIIIALRKAVTSTAAQDIEGFNPKLKGYTYQKITALLTQLIKEGIVGRRLFFHTPYFYLIELEKEQYWYEEETVEVEDEPVETVVVEDEPVELVEVEQA